MVYNTRILSTAEPRLYTWLIVIYAIHSILNILWYFGRKIDYHSKTAMRKDLQCVVQYNRYR